jgi:hypothetical protein
LKIDTSIAHQIWDDLHLHTTTTRWGERLASAPFPLLNIHLDLGAQLFISTSSQFKIITRKMRRKGHFPVVIHLAFSCCCYPTWLALCGVLHVTGLPFKLAFRQSSSFLVDLTVHGDVEANPGPPIQISTPAELTSFKRSFGSDRVDWLLKWEGPAVLELLAYTWSNGPTTARKRTDHDTFIASALNVWETVFGFPPPFVPSTTAQLGWDMKTMAKWRDELPVDQIAHAESYLKHSCADHTIPVDAEQAAKKQKILLPAFVDDLLGTLPLPHSWNIKCPADNCNSMVDTTWALASHINSAHLPLDKFCYG